MTARPAVWPVFAAYVLAFATIVVFSIVAAAAVRSAYPDLPEDSALLGLPGLLAGGLASSSALLTTLLLVARPLEPGRYRLVPGRESGRALLVMVAGVLALGQALDSAIMLLGLGNRGSMAQIRRALQEAAGPELFGAVVVIGLVAGSAEEIFFRGYMQSRLRERWRAVPAVLVTSLCFALFHVELIHVVIALALGLYLGFVTEATGSALPAAVCHVVNNALFTVATVAIGTVAAFWPNVVVLVVSAGVFAGCVLWLRGALRASVPT